MIYSNSVSIQWGVRSGMSCALLTTALPARHIRCLLPQMDADKNIKTRL